MIDLVSQSVGGRVLEFNDEFFAEADNLIKPADPVWKEDEYTDRGKWMDGWETRRRREPGHDWCVLELGVPGRIRQVVVDTAHFTGNYPEAFSLEASSDGRDWVEVITRTPLEGDAEAVFDVDFAFRVKTVRLNIFPDGGVARLRVVGDPIPDMQTVCGDGLIDLAAAVVGGRWLEASDYHYSPPSNLLLPSESSGMWDGWETRRRRGPGHDWATFELGMSGTVSAVSVDTTHFKGNCPGWVSFDVSDDGVSWVTVVDEVAVFPDRVNLIELDAPTHTAFARISIHPDGGLARLRVLGRPDPGSAGRLRLDYLNSLFEAEADSFFRTACGSERWLTLMRAGRPFPTIDSIFDRAGSAFDELDEADWLEAFAGHPRIGERGDEVANREQSGTASASRELIAELAKVNAEYEEKFGFTYIVYASGKTAEEMLGIARQRLSSDRTLEIGAAAAEQRKITTTRLRRMLCQEEV